MNLQQALENRKFFNIRSFYEWSEANNGITHINVCCLFPNVSVPQEYVNDDCIVLNISSSSCNNIEFDFEKYEIRFTARFNKIERKVIVPIDAIYTTWEKVSGVGENYPINLDDIKPTSPTTNKKAEVHLKVVK